MKWAKDNKITFNEQKSKAMVVTRKKRRENKDVSIYLNNKPLEQFNNIKYLGIIMDSKLNFREHIMCTAGKCTKLIHALAKSAKLTWGLNHEALNTIQRSYFASHDVQRINMDRGNGKKMQQNVI